MNSTVLAIDAVKQELRAAGLRATPARLAVLKLLRDARTPLAHTEVTAQLSPLGFDVATIFRSLNTMVDAGLLRKMELSDHVWRYETSPIAGDQHGTHPHFLCIDCGIVTCMEQVCLTSCNQVPTSSVGEVTEILIRGHCNRCRRAIPGEIGSWLAIQ